MISVSALRLELFNLWKDIGTGKKLLVYHRRKVYQVTIKPTDQKLPGYSHTPKLKKQELKKATCSKCGFLEVNGICLAKCTNNT